MLRRFLFVVLIVGSVWGCGGSKSLVGSWVADAGKSTVDDQFGPQQQALAEGFLKKITLELRADKTGVFTLGVPLEGKWSESDSKVLFSYSASAGENALEFTFTRVGSDLEFAPPQSQGKYVFVKQ